MLEGVRSFTEPLWQVKVQPTALEGYLLEQPALRRLAGVFHYGLAARVTPVRHTRLEHSLGVYALAVHFRPFDVTLRAAALLHDLGHLPFSHAAEAALGASHHARSELLLAGLEPLFKAHHLRLEHVRRAVNGHSPLRPGPGVLGLDHLDSFVRNGVQAGASVSAPELLMQLSLVGGAISTYPETALSLLGLIEDELLRMTSSQVSWADWLSEQILRSLGYSADSLARMSENEILALASAHPEASVLLGLLYATPQGTPRPNLQTPLYANYPLVGGLPAQLVMGGEIRALEERLELQPLWQFSLPTVH